ncbi:MAG: hypothetical protein ICV31_00555 [Rubrobacter sp.]|nr:hypothetical protein [Rubrobacter sp.]
MEKSHAVVATKALRGISSLVFGLVLFGLLVNLFSREEVYTSLEYGFPLLAFFGAAGCIGQLTVSISRRSGALASACCIPEGILRATLASEGVRGEARHLPILMALLLGPLVVLLAGLGGWV